MKLMQNLKLSSLVILLLFLICVTGCTEKTSKNQAVVTKEVVATPVIAITQDKPWSERMALSVIKRAPEAWMNDFQTKPKWNYTLGLVLDALVEVSHEKKNILYADYAQGYGDTMIYADGSIRDYEIEKFNIDYIAPGPLLFDLYEKTGDEKYRTAIETLHQQLTWQPRTTEGGYWHKLRYPWQMWLDGLYMGEPFHAEYARKFDRPEIFDHIAHQFHLVEKHLRDEKTGLLYHGWDESRIQRWANPETGLSSHFWGRAVGWYCMGLVDVLPHFPEDHPEKQQLIQILKQTLDAAIKVQDPATHTWWQILDMPGEPGNYLESTASCMFTYALLKGVNNGYLSEAYRPVAEKSYAGLLSQFIRVDPDGEVHLTDGCSVAGLGGNPYRDGSYAYYINEPIRDNDPKGLGPFIRASLELEKSKKGSKL